MLFALEPRFQPSQAMRYIAPLIALALTLLCGFILFLVLGTDPLKGFSVFFIDPLKDLYGLSELLLKATPLMIIAVGLACGFRANIWNIGAEGQYVLGAMGATGVALYFSESENSFLVLTCMALAGCAAGALWASIPAFLRTKFSANEILVSLMLVYIAKLFVSWSVHGPWKDPEGFNFPQSPLFSDAALLPILLEDTRLNIFFLLGIVILGAAYVFIFHSHAGFQMKVAGQTSAAARYAGFSANKTIWSGLLIGGGLSGLAGMAEVAGPLGQLTDNVSNNYGFSAIIVAFVGRLHPFGIFLASLLMALLYLGGELSQQYLGLPSSISMVFQGMLLLFLLGSDVFINYRLKWTGFKN